MDAIIQLVWQIVMLPVGLIFGGMAERKHFRQLDEREAQLPVPLDNRKHVTRPEQVVHAQMISGQVVIATDYWKSFLMKLRNLVGGEARSADRLMQRGRREALMRLRESAARLGANEVWNVRLQFSNISMMQGKRGGNMQVEVFAYGTAVKRRAANG
ncbi:MAG: heavy metal-binding domain-containing protein [Planctomycetota bacterium]